ncbi:hypothetical protein Ancab_037438 [Ancistrocladus abbreviatus]
MEEDKSGGGDSSSSRVSSSFEKLDDRIRFTVELRPGETTIVSWKKLMKDAAKTNGPAAAPEPPTNVHPTLESRLAPGQPSANEDASHPSRFSAVIEKIERLYMGKDSSDDEDLEEIPDDDQYDTEDSFIDDAELDEYFEVDKSKTKHDGFFVNRGKLESIEPSQSSIQQPKKRRRKEMAKAPVDSYDHHTTNKHMKVGKKGAVKVLPLSEKNSSSATQGFAVKDGHYEHNQFNASGAYPEKTAVDVTSTLDPALVRASNGDVFSSLPEMNDCDKQKAGIFSAKNPTNKLKDTNEFSDTAHAKHPDRGVYAQIKLQTGKQSNMDGLETSSQQKDKCIPHEQLDLNLADGKHSMQFVKNSVMQKKEGSSVRPKSNTLEKAIRELEKMVAESRPPASDVQDADVSSQAVKRRLPREIKLKLAKVAKIAQASQGKISKELLNRLMSILGHVIQLRTLKRHLKVMISTSLSAKQEKDDKFQRIKKEVVEMIRMRAPSLMSKAIEQQLGGSDDFQESGCEEKRMVKGQHCMDAAMEDKICDLYDIFVDGLDEDAAPQVRKLYTELAELWPKGVMDNHGIKRAICRAKERRRAQQERNKDQEKIKRKKLAAAKIEDNAKVESSSAVQISYLQERLVTGSSGHVVNSQNRFLSGPTAAVPTSVIAPNPAPLALCVVPGHSQNAPNLDRPKQEKVKGISSGSYCEVRTADDVIVKKKVKRKPEPELGATNLRPEKVHSQPSDDRHKSHKLQVASIPVSGAPQKSNFQSAALPSFEQLT